MVPQPIPGRDCGECSACCVDLNIDDPELRKPDGAACPHLSAACGGCAVYETRPRTCRSWHCGWQLLGSLGEAMRPDRSKVMLVPEIGAAEGQGQGGLMIVPVGGDVSGVMADELTNLIAKCVAGGVPIWLSYGVGAACRRLLTNPLLEPAVGAADRADFLRRLAQVLDDLVAEVDTPKPRRWESGPWRVRMAERTPP